MSVAFGEVIKSSALNGSPLLGVLIVAALCWLFLELNGFIKFPA